jgi:hypothetical protein
MLTRRRLFQLGEAALLLAAARVARRSNAGDPVQVYLPQLQAIPTPVPVLTGAIVAPASGTSAQAIDWFAARCDPSYTRYDVALIVGAYEAHGQASGIDWFLALAQSALETGHLTSWFSLRPRRNPAGIGVTGAVQAGLPDTPPGEHWAWDARSSQWREGISFAEWATQSVPAHLGRLLAYALPVGAGTPAQQALIDIALAYRPLPSAYRGIAPTITGLNGRWAVPGTTYGETILVVAASMRGA